jgi:hypothetical protein
MAKIISLFKSRTHREIWEDVIWLCKSNSTNCRLEPSEGKIIFTADPKSIRKLVKDVKEWRKGRSKDGN